MIYCMHTHACRRARTYVQWPYLPGEKITPGLIVESFSVEVMLERHTYRSQLAAEVRT